MEKNGNYIKNTEDKTDDDSGIPERRCVRGTAAEISFSVSGI